MMPADSRPGKILFVTEKVTVEQFDQIGTDLETIPVKNLRTLKNLTANNT